jgi:predicted HicB family RNase H-like nuclease
MTKKRMGRPPVDNPASEVLGTVRLTPEQKAAYVDAAEAEDMKLAAWVKRTLDRAAARVLNKSAK